MSETQSLVRARFRTPDGRLLLHSSRDGGSATYAVVTKETDADPWMIIGVYGTREAAARELEHKAISAPTLECLIIECEPY